MRAYANTHDTHKHTHTHTHTRACKRIRSRNNRVVTTVAPTSVCISLKDLSGLECCMSSIKSRDEPGGNARRVAILSLRRIIEW